MTCSERGKIVEEKFRKSLENTLNKKGLKYTLTKTNFNEDVYEHIDFVLEYGDKKRSFDVKGKKKVNRSDENETNNLHWIELTNVNGEKGWVYGEATHIAFETDEGFMLVKRRNLIDLINEKCADEKIYNSEDTKKKETYKKYNRKGRKDVIVLVPNSDIEKIKEKFIFKI